MKNLRKVRLVTGEDVGTHDVWIMADSAGRRFVFKPTDPGSRWRAEVEEGANALGRMWGFKTPTAWVTTIDGEDGLLMEFVEHVSSFRPLTYALDTLTEEQIGQVAAEHVFDWVLDNDDTHASNLLLDSAGDVVGIDKGRAFFVYGNWSGLTADWHAHSNADLVYTRLYDDIRDGVLSEEHALAAYRAAVAAAKRIAESDDEDVENLVRRATANRPKWSRPGYMTHYTDVQAPICQDDLISALLARKAWIVDDIEDMWCRIFARSPYSKPRRMFVRC